MLTIKKSYDETINAITHTAPHHADEVFATVMLSIVMPVNLFRTRDMSVIRNTNAVVYDVGGEFDPENGRFDHHQQSFFGYRSDGIKYSSAGLIWREYGNDVVKRFLAEDTDEETISMVATKIDDALIKGIDAADNDQVTDTSATISSIIYLFNALRGSNEDDDDCFQKACEIATIILERNIKVAIARTIGKTNF